MLPLLPTNGSAGLVLPTGSSTPFAGCAGHGQRPDATSCTVVSGANPPDSAAYKSAWQFLRQQEAERQQHMRQAGQAERSSSTLSAPPTTAAGLGDAPGTAAPQPACADEAPGVHVRSASLPDLHTPSGELAHSSLRKFTPSTVLAPSPPVGEKAGTQMTSRGLSERPCPLASPVPLPSDLSCDLVADATVQLVRKSASKDQLHVTPTAAAPADPAAAAADSAAARPSALGSDLVAMPTQQDACNNGVTDQDLTGAVAIHTRLQLPAVNAAAVTAAEAGLPAQASSQMLPPAHPVLLRWQRRSVLEGAAEAAPGVVDVMFAWQGLIYTGAAVEQGPVPPQLPQAACKGSLQVSLRGGVCSFLMTRRKSSMQPVRLAV